VGGVSHLIPLSTGLPTDQRHNRGRTTGVKGKKDEGKLHITGGGGAT